MAVDPNEEARGRAQAEGLAQALAARDAAGLAPPPPPPASNFTSGLSQAARGVVNQVVDAVPKVDPLTGKFIDGPFAGLTAEQAQAVIASQAKPGGLPQGSYKVNPDGTFTLLQPMGGGQPGDTVAANGGILKPDGTPRAGSDGVQYFLARTPSGEKATDNPNFYGESDPLKKAADFAKDVVTNNPIATPFRVGYDIATGGNANDIKNDVVSSQSGGIAGVDENGNITAGPVAKDVASGVGDAVPGLGDLLSGLGGGGSDIDPSIAKDQIDRSNSLADALEVDRQKAGAQADADRALGLQTREQQQDAIRQLQDAASGKVPSAAELALTRQSGIDAARQYGLAAALQGSNPAAALRQASMGAARVAGDTTANAAQLRAKEQADARTALANTLAGVRQGDQTSVNTDVNQQGNAQSGETASNSTATTGAGNILNSEAEKEKAKAIREGAIISGAGSLATTLLTKSDRRAKKDVAKAGLADALAKGVHGVTFEYVAPEDEREDGPQFGVLAQELERVVPGAVRKREDGVKMVDTGHMTLANTAILSELAKRLIALEGKGGRR